MLPARVAARLLLSAFALTALLRPAPAGEIVTEPEITYGKGGDVDLKLDLARPKDGDGPFPAIVFVHGGGWRGGNRSGYKAAIEDAARHGYVAVTVSYRLVREENGKRINAWPVQINDVKCAVRWLRANAAKYKVDPKRIGATGGSAGGHLSLLLGLTDEADGLEGTGGNGDQSSQVQAVVNVFGPTDLPRMMENSPQGAPIVEVFLNGKPADIADTYKKASPISYVAKDSPPILTLHGKADTLVPPDQAERLDKAMNDAGASHAMILFEGEGHGFKPETNVKAAAAMYEFFDKHLKK